MEASNMPDMELKTLVIKTGKLSENLHNERNFKNN